MRRKRKAASAGLSLPVAEHEAGEVPTLFVAGEEAGAGEEGSGVEEGEVEVVEEGAAVAEAGELGGGAAGGAAAVAEDGAAVAAFLEDGVVFLKRAAVAEDEGGRQGDALLFLREVVGGGVALHTAAQGGEQEVGGGPVAFAVGEHRRESGGDRRILSNQGNESKKELR